ncbi:MAG: hypothetical protein AAF362_01595 [Pseudomonadota bacterium]
MKTVLIIGSAPDAVQAASWPKPRDTLIVAINNAWRIREDWDYLIHPDDFPEDRLPETVSANQEICTSAEYVPAQNRYGGFVYAGGTMAFTAGYWALDALKPQIMAYIGCDMIYDGSTTHFYGSGTADPLREDVTLANLEAKSARLMALASVQGCVCVNLSKKPKSRLIFPRASSDDLDRTCPIPKIDQRFVEDALKHEMKLNYFVESGEYWKQMELFDPKEIAEIDKLWLSSCASSAASDPVF